MLPEHPSFGVFGFPDFSRAQQESTHQWYVCSQLKAMPTGKTSIHPSPAPARGLNSCNVFTQFEPDQSVASDNASGLCLETRFKSERQVRFGTSHPDLITTPFRTQFLMFAEEKRGILAPFAATETPSQSTRVRPHRAYTRLTALVRPHWGGWPCNPFKPSPFSPFCQTASGG